MEKKLLNGKETLCGKEIVKRKDYKNEISKPLTVADHLSVFADH